MHNFARNFTQLLNNKIYTLSRTFVAIYLTRNSSGDEIANVNFLYDDIVQWTSA